MVGGREGGKQQGFNNFTLLGNKNTSHTGKFKPRAVQTAEQEKPLWDGAGLDSSARVSQSLPVRWTSTSQTWRKDKKNHTSGCCKQLRSDEFKRNLFLREQNELKQSGF